MNLFSLWRQWNPYQSRSNGLRGVLDLFLENNPGIVVADRRLPPSTHTKSPGATVRRQTSPQADRADLSKISSFASFQNIGRTCFSTYSFDASHVETGRPPTTARRLATAIQVLEQGPRNGHHAGRNPILFRHEIKASLVPWTGRTQSSGRDSLTYQGRNQCQAIFSSFFNR
jgi:hypothetical protein